MNVVENSGLPNPEGVKEWGDEYLFEIYEDDVYREFIKKNNPPMYDMVLKEIRLRRNKKLDEILK